MEITLALKQNILNAFNKLGVSLNMDDIVIEHSKDPLHGDYATNAALKFSRLLGKNPREVANDLVNNLDKSDIEKIEIAGPGFINFFMKRDTLAGVVKKIIDAGDNYGHGEVKNIRINVEFVSANPTGDLHIGHAKGAAIGDSICRILEFAGYDVTREYYVNDAGNQIYNLALSLEARYREQLGLDFSLPEDGYHGQDIIDIAKKLKEEYGDKLLSNDNNIQFFRELGIKYELDKILKDLEMFRVKFDVFSSEVKIRSNNAVEKELEYLKPYIYTDEGAKVLKTTEFLDDKDRVIVKSNGDYTYFLPDIVYHVDKMSRKYDLLVDVLGADHHGYINRLKSALMMHGYSKDVLEVVLYQMVRIVRGNEEIKMSKRTGNALTLRDLVDYVGIDAARYFFVMRSATAHLDFDLDLALEQSSNNPVYYAFYAHARLASVLDQASDIPLDINASKSTTKSEIDLMKHLLSFPKEVEDSASLKDPHKITNYIHELATLVHAFYSECKIINRDELDVTASRLALCKASKIVLKNALNLIGVNAPDRM